MKTMRGSKKTSVKPNRDKRYEILDINHSARSEMRGFDLLFVLGGKSLDCTHNHSNCNHTDVTEAFGKFGNQTELIEVHSITELRTSEKLAEKELHRLILKFRDWSVMYSQGGHDCSFMRLHPLYLQIVSVNGGVTNPLLQENHKVYRHR